MGMSRQTWAGFFLAGFLTFGTAVLIVLDQVGILVALMLLCMVLFVAFLDTTLPWWRK